MDQIRDEQYHFDGPGGPAWCHLQVYQGADGAVLALATEGADNPGVSITAWADRLAHAVWREAGAPPVFTWIEHYPPDLRAGLAESFALVQFGQAPDGTFTTPRWQPLTRDTVEALLTAPEGTVGVGGSLPPQHLRLACVTCGQPLAVSEVLAEARQCAACASGQPSQAVQAAEGTDEDLAAARAAWLERTNAHEIRLGLTRRQRAALRGALQGQRSLWSFSAAELSAMVEQLERLEDVAAVRAFLAAHAGDTGLSPSDWQ
jgi:hypothetical protein